MAALYPPSISASPPPQPPSPCSLLRQESRDACTLHKTFSCYANNVTGGCSGRFRCKNGMVVRCGNGGGDGSASSCAADDARAFLCASSCECGTDTRSSIGRGRTTHPRTSTPLICEGGQAEEITFERALHKLSSLPLKAMGDSSVLADLVREVGLVRDWYRRPLYGREKIYEHRAYSRLERGANINFGMFQLPEQVGCLLSELARLPTRLRTFVEVGSFYGWTGLFFQAFLRRLFEESVPPWRRSSAGAKQMQGFRSVSFDVTDMRTPCVEKLTARYEHAFHLLPYGTRLRNGTRLPRPTLASDFGGAAAWYRQRLAESLFSHSSSTMSSGARAVPKIDLCFIDGLHSLEHVTVDVWFFQPRCRFLLFHDITDADSKGVRDVWWWLSSRLRRERAQLIASGARVIEQHYLVKECTQQAGTNRSNFGLGLIAAPRLNTDFPWQMAADWTLPTSWKLPTS